MTTELKKGKRPENEIYEKKGYLENDFKYFHLIDKEERNYNYHYHDFNKILVFIKGDVEYTIEGNKYKLKPYDIVLINSSEVHRPEVNSQKEYERIIIYVSDRFMDKYSNEEYQLNNCFKNAKANSTHVLRIPNILDTKIYKTLKELDNSAKDQDYANELYHKVIFLEFLIKLNRAVVHSNIDYVETNYSNEKIINTLQFINDNINKEISIEEIAENIFVNKYYLMHLFKEETGYSIGSYINAKRLILAKELIRSGKTMTQACFDSGYQNYSTFSRAYRKSFGVCPREDINL